LSIKSCGSAILAKPSAGRATAEPVFVAAYHQPDSMTNHAPWYGGGIRDVENTMKKALGLIGLLRWIFPIFMLAGGRLVPGLQLPVTLTWPMPEPVYPPLLVELIIGLVWIVSEITTVTNRDTPVRTLQLDDGMSLTLAIVLTFFGAWQIARGSLQWWFIVPWIVTLVDAYLSGYFAINNAAQKPLVQQQRL
jgi:hypothetical protein